MYLPITITANLHHKVVVMHNTNLAHLQLGNLSAIIIFNSHDYVAFLNFLKYIVLVCPPIYPMT